jgi:TonB family protein
VAAALEAVPSAADQPTDLVLLPEPLPVMTESPASDDRASTPDDNASRAVVIEPAILEAGDMQDDRPMVSPTPARAGARHRRMTAAVAILAALASSTYWIKSRGSASDREEPPVSVSDLTVSDTPLSRPNAETVATSAPSTRPTVRLTKHVTPSGRATGRPQLVIPPAAAPAIAVAPVPPAPEPPFFETTEVNEAPQVATRISLRIPDELKSNPPKDVVVARILVSQTGQPSRVRLLRKSKAGSRLDEAVIAAVNQWTFTAARKRGESVSCWLNVAVPIGQAE